MFIQLSCLLTVCVFPSIKTNLFNWNLFILSYKSCNKFYCLYNFFLLLFICEPYPAKSTSWCESWKYWFVHLKIMHHITSLKTNFTFILSLILKQIYDKLTTVNNSQYWTLRSVSGRGKFEKFCMLWAICWTCLNCNASQNDCRSTLYGINMKRRLPNGL